MNLTDKILNFQDPASTIAYHIISLHNDILGYMILTLCIVYWALYKIIKEFAWYNYKYTRGFFDYSNNSFFFFIIYYYINYIGSFFFIFYWALWTIYWNIIKWTDKGILKISSFFTPLSKEEEELILDLWSEPIIHRIGLILISKGKFKQLLRDHFMAYILQKHTDSEKFLEVQNFRDNFGLEMLLMAFPAWVISTILIPSLILIYSIDPEADPLFDVKAIGHQWFWSYEVANLQEEINTESDYIYKVLNRESLSNDWKKESIEFELKNWKKLSQRFRGWLPPFKDLAERIKLSNETIWRRVIPTSPFDFGLMFTHVILAYERYTQDTWPRGKKRPVGWFIYKTIEKENYVNLLKYTYSSALDRARDFAVLEIIYNRLRLTPNVELIDSMNKNQIKEKIFNYKIKLTEKEAEGDLMPMSTEELVSYINDYFLNRDKHLSYYFRYIFTEPCIPIRDPFFYFPLSALRLIVKNPLLVYNDAISLRRSLTFDEKLNHGKQTSAGMVYDNRVIVDGKLKTYLEGEWGEGSPIAKHALVYNTLYSLRDIYRDLYNIRFWRDFTYVSDLIKYGFADHYEEKDRKAMISSLDSCINSLFICLDKKASGFWFSFRDKKYLKNLVLKKLEEEWEKIKDNEDFEEGKISDSLAKRILTEIWNVIFRGRTWGIQEITILVSKFVDSFWEENLDVKKRKKLTHSYLDKEILDNLKEDLVRHLLKNSIKVKEELNLKGLDNWGNISLKKEISKDSVLVSEEALELGQKRLLTVDNYLTIPIHLPIRFLITSSDVLHSWAMPELGLKVDAVPGRLNQLIFLATKPGMYYGQCSELCGVGHAFMPIVVKCVVLKD